MASDYTLKIIEKILSNSASEAEIEEFNSWLEESGENREFYLRVKALWKKLDATNNDIGFDKVIAKENIISKIKLRQKSQTRKMRYWISAAASVLLLIGTGYAIFFSNNIINKSIVYNSQQNEVLNILLPDSSKVWLNENSSLVVAKSFNNRNRKIVLHGEAYFEVARNEEKVFKIISGRTTTKVLGTSFNLKNDEKNNVQLIVNNGKVQFYTRFSFKNREIYSAGEKGEYLFSEGEIQHDNNTDLNYISWKTGILSFSDTPFNEVCKVISRHYKVPVKTIVDNKSLLLTGTFRNEDLEDILSTIAITFDIKIEKAEEGFQFINNKEKD